MTPHQPPQMNIVGHELIKKHVKHCRSESFPLVVAVVLWVTEWVGCFRRLDLNKKLHPGEIGLSIGVKEIISHLS